MKVTNLRAGDVYQFSETDRPFFLQVTDDADCGVFRGTFEEVNFTTEEVEYRIIATQQSVKREMKRIGNFPIHPSLSRPYFYFERDIGSEEIRKVSIIDPALNDIISAEEAKDLEPLDRKSVV